jgi:hypothetical protein
VFGGPLTTDEVLDRAIAHADSAIATAGTDALIVSIINAASVVKGRALLAKGQFAAAATAVANVPTAYQYLHQQSQSSRDNGVWAFNNNARRYTVVNVEGGTGIDFIAAADPRLPVTGPVVDGGFDANTDLYRQQLFPARETSFAVASGVEARLIEAEAQVMAGQGPTALITLNTLRSTTGRLQSGAALPAGLTPLVLQVGQAAQINQVMRERAFWLYGSGHRLGDLRRLIRHHGRDSETVFPTGAFHKTGTYGPDVNFPVTQAEENNPNFTGCIDRNA